MKDLFSGPLGRLNNHGGSRMFTTPNTIYVPPEYEVETDVPSVAEFVTCSLDGRLWVWKRSKRYYVAAFRWDEDTQTLVFAGTTIINGETLIKRGVDWILTDKSLILASNNEPYISRTEYESDDTTYIDKINQSYSFFPEFKTWSENFSSESLDINNSPLDAWKKIPRSKFTAIEFYYSDKGRLKSIKSKTIRLISVNGQIYAKGELYVGRAYLFPINVNSNGIASAFYLCISPDYCSHYTIRDDGLSTLQFDTSDEWDNLLLAPLDNSSASVFTPNKDNAALCKQAKDAQVFALPQCEILDFSDDDGGIFFDGRTTSTLVLNNKGVSFLRDNLFYKSNSLCQWIAPAGKINLVSPELIISSSESISLTCFLQQGFYMALCLGENMLPLTAKNLALTWHNRGGKKFLNAYKCVTVFSTANNAIAWDEAYRDLIIVTPINSFSHKVEGEVIKGVYISEINSQYVEANILEITLYDENNLPR